MKVRLKILLDEPRGSAWRPPARGVNCSVKSGIRMSDAMTRKMKLDPNVCYVIGVFSCNSKEDRIGITSNKGEFIEKFISISVKDLKVPPNKITISEEGRWTKVFYYHSKIRKNFGRVLERRSNIFRWRNDYSSNYIAGIFDCCGGFDKKGIYMKALDLANMQLISNLGFHTQDKGGKSYLSNPRQFIIFIADHSVIAESIIHSSGNERDLR